MSWRSTRRILIVLALLVLVSGLWIGGRTPVPAPISAPTPRAAPEAVMRTAEVRDEASARPEQAAIAKRPDAKAREALRRDIVRALEHRGVPVATTSARDRSDAADAPTPAGGMTDRLGGHDALLKRLNEDFMPLADECIDAARERDPDLHGLVALDVELLAEKDIGAIVESAEPAGANTVADPELMECLQETLLSMSLPGDAVDGREGIMISLRTDS